MRFIPGLTNNEINYLEYDGKLSKAQFEIFKIWMKSYFDNNISLYGATSDFLLFVIGYDKAETTRKKLLVQLILILILDYLIIIY